MENDDSSQQVEPHTDPQSSDTPQSPEPPNRIHADSKGETRHQPKVENFAEDINAIEKRMLLLTGVMALCALITVSVGIFQWRTMEGQLLEMKDTGKQTDALIRQSIEHVKAANRLADVAGESLLDARGQFQISQRPYVMHKVEPVFPQVGKPISANLYLANYGRSPAIRVQTRGAILVGRDALEQADRWFADEASRPIPDASFSTIVPPGGMDRLNAVFLTLSTNRAINQKEWEGITKNAFPIVIVTRHQYFDTAGNRYWTDLCVSFAPEGQIPNCPKHNEIH